MKGAPNIGELNRRITINEYIFGRDDSGGNIKALSDSYEVWANVKQKNGSRLLEQMQITYNEAYEILKWHEVLRVLPLNAEIIYEESLLSIAAIEKLNEGKKVWNKITAYTTGKTISGTGEPIYRIVGEPIHYVAVGDEYSFQDNDLIGWSIILVFRDGINYTVFMAPYTPVNKQVVFDNAVGTIAFASNLPALKPGEVVDVYRLVKNI